MFKQPYSKVALCLLPSLFLGGFLGCSSPNERLITGEQTKEDNRVLERIEGSWEVEFSHDWQDEDSHMRNEAAITYHFNADGVFSRTERSKILILNDRFSNEPREISDGTDSVNGSWEWQGKRVVAIYGGKNYDAGTEEFKFDGAKVIRTRLETRTEFTEPQRLILERR